MAVADAVTPQFQMARVIKRTFSVIGNNTITFSILSLVVGIPMLVLDIALNPLTSGAPVDDPFNAEMLRYSALFWAVYMLCTFVLQAGIVKGTISYLNGTTASLGDCLSTGIAFLLPFAWMTVLMFLAFIVAFILLIIPGLILAMMWFVAAPACVVERTGVLGALRRSRELTKGYRWHIFGLYVAFFVLAIVLAVTSSAVTGATLYAGSPEAAVAAAVNRTFVQLATSIVITMLNSVILATLVVSIYYELRQIKEGIGPEALASVFD